MSRSKSPPRKQAYHHGDLRRALLDATERLIREQGVDHVSLRAIARSAGVSHAAPYHHFSDVEDLLAAVAAGGFVRLRDAMMTRASTADLPPIRQLQEAGIAYVRFAAENPEIYRLMFSGRLRELRDHADLADASASTYRTLGELLSQAGGATSPEPEIIPSATGQATWALVHGLSMLLIDGRLDIDRTNTEQVEGVARDVTRVLGLGLRDSG